jgi:hypothetical protein
MSKGFEQALTSIIDLIAAIPGLLNLPEVNAFPARVTAVQWDSYGGKNNKAAYQHHRQ